MFFRKRYKKIYFKRQKIEYDNIDQFYNDDEDEELNSNDGDITPTIECENVINSE